MKAVVASFAALLSCDAQPVNIDNDNIKDKPKTAVFFTELNMKSPRQQ
jgi:hypothetical protein